MRTEIGEGFVIHFWMFICVPGVCLRVITALGCRGGEDVFY